MKLSVQSRKAWQCNLTSNFWFNILTVWGQILVNIILSWIWNNNYITKTELAVSSTSSWGNCLDFFNNKIFANTCGTHWFVNSWLGQCSLYFVCNSSETLSPRVLYILYSLSCRTATLYWRTKIALQGRTWLVIGQSSLDKQKEITWWSEGPQIFSSS